MKKTVILMSLLVMLFFAAACDKVEKKRDSKEEIFSCSAENIIGISSIYMDEGAVTLSFDAEDVDASDIARIQFSVSDQYIIDIENMELSATGFGCDCIEYYSQCYDSGSDSWDEIEYRFVACPEECFDD